MSLKRKQTRISGSEFPFVDDEVHILPGGIVAPSIKRPKNSRRKKKLVTKSKSTSGSNTGGYPQYLLEFFKVFRIIFSLKFLPCFTWGSNWGGWAHVSKREILLRLPSMCKRSFHYYSLRIVASRTATFFLRIKRFRPGKL